MVIKPGSALLYIILGLFNLEDSFIAGILSWVVCISVSLSLYYLVLFYYALKVPLAPYRPLLKFLTIKITLFFTF